MRCFLSATISYFCICGSDPKLGLETGCVVFYQANLVSSGNLKSSTSYSPFTLSIRIVVMSNDCCDYGRSANESCGPSHFITRQLHVMIGFLKPNGLGKQVIASSLGSLVTVLTLNPLSVLKVRLQSSNSLQEGASGALYKEVQSVYSSRGVRGFWSGASMGLVMSIPSTIVYMSSYERTKALLADIMYVSSWIVPALAGATARLISVSVVSPMELIRTIQQSNYDAKQQSFVKIARNIIQSPQGYRGLYRGWASTVLRDCPFSAIYWFSFERFKPMYNKYNVNNQESSMSTFLAGSTAGLIAATISHPFDVMKTKQQSLFPSSTMQMQPPVQALSLGSILKVEGIAGLYRGLGLRLFTVIPSCGILITVYEAIKTIDFD